MKGKLPKRRIYLIGIIFIGLLVSCSLLQTVNFISADERYYIAIFLAVGLGFLCLKIAPVKLEEHTFYKALSFPVIIVVLAALAIAVVYYFLNLSYYFISFVLAFIIPALIWQTYVLFLAIPSDDYKIWYYPINEEMPDLEMIDLSEINIVQFIFNKNLNDLADTRFTAKAPLKMTLGQLFFIFVNDYNEKNPNNTIVFLDADNAPFGWYFYKEKKLFRKRGHFDPDLSFHDNNIKPNENIFAVRVNTPNIPYQVSETESG